jgi:HSP20 family protein
MMNGSLRVPGSMAADLERFQQQLERILPRFQSASSIRATSGGEFPAVNIGITPDTIEIVAFAPGIDAKSVELSIDKGLLILVGVRSNSVPEGDERISVYAQERFVGPFRRVISLPEDADPARVTANYRDGFLRISVGKRESSKPRRIEVRT